MRFKTLKIQHQPDDSYIVAIDGSSCVLPDLRTLSDFIAEVDSVPAVQDVETGENNTKKESGT